MRMGQNVIRGMSGSPTFFLIISYRHDFRKKKKFEYKICVLSLFTTFAEIFLILRKKWADRIKMYIVLHEKYPLLLSDFNETWIFLTDFPKELKYKI